MLPLAVHPTINNRVIVFDLDGDEDALLSRLAGIEAQSEHPIAAAIRRAWPDVLAKIFALGTTDDVAGVWVGGEHLSQTSVG